jgi:hypothetical protein
MGVARDQVRQPPVDQGPGAACGPLPEAPVDRRSRQLHQRPTRDQRIQQPRPLLNVGIPFRVGEDDAEALQPQLEEPLGDVERPAPVRRLDEQPP